MLFRIALRNLRLHWVRTLIVGILLSMGTALTMIGQGAIDAIQDGIQRSVVDTLSGHLQLYSKGATDALELYRPPTLAEPELGEIPDFSKLKAAVLELPEFRAVIPMGTGRSLVWGESPLEGILRRLRQGLRASELGEKSEDPLPLLRHARRLVTEMKAYDEDLQKVVGRGQDSERQESAFKKAAQDEFWASYPESPLQHIEFLENEILPLSLQSGFHLVNYLGTDLQAFAKNFRLFRLVKGDMVEEGQRGFLFNEFYYEKFMKNQVARRFDDIHTGRLENGESLKDTPSLQQKLLRNQKEAHRLLGEMEDGALKALKEELQSYLESTETELSRLVTAFFEMDDASFDSRYQAFYRYFVPKLKLYLVDVGDIISLYGQTSQGYPRAVNLRVSGVFRYEGLEKASLAGVYNLMDLVSYRDLTGLGQSLSEEERQALLDRAQIQEVSEEDAELALFGEDESLVGERESEAFDELMGRDISGMRERAMKAMSERFQRKDLEEGSLVHAAVFLQDPARDLPRLQELQAKLNAHLEAKGLDVQAIDWKEARGMMVSSLAIGINVFFYVLVGIIFLVALIVIVNSLLMSTMERVQEIGTIRAMGAQKSFIIKMFAIEASCMTLIFGFLGMFLGLLALLFLNHYGIPADSEVLYFIFGGPSLHPVLRAEHFLLAFSAIAIVTTVASLLPASLAAKITPVVAMQEGD